MPMSLSQRQRFPPGSQANSRSEPQPQQSVEYPLGMEAAERRLQLQVFQFPEKICLVLELSL